MTKLKKIGVISLGCSKNLVDTEVMLGHLAAQGYQILEDFDEVDCLLVNTCAFLSEAVTESLDQIVELAKQKGEGRADRLVVTGCMVSRYGEDLGGEIPEIDGVVHPKNLEGIVEAVTGKKPIKRSEHDKFPPRLRSFPYHRAYLKIGEGCSNHCSYCMIPSLRGEFSSREVSSILDEVRWLLDQDVSEITLVSQDSGRYGLDGPTGSLSGLLREVLKIEGDCWLRVLYIHPSRVDEELLDVMASDERVCRYLDVPFQHVSARILDLMGREDAPDARDVLELVRRRLPDVSIRSTLMTGFPGETEEDFNELLQFVKNAGIDHLGVFPYSREEGTLAADFPGQVPHELARERMNILLAAQKNVSAALLKALVGKNLEVVIEGADEEGTYGRHRGQAPEVDGVVYLDRPQVLGDVVSVRITESSAYDLTGEILD